jgi:hypothetical protein
LAKNLGKTAFFAQITASLFLRKVNHNVGFGEKRHFSAENW